MITNSSLAAVAVPMSAVQFNDLSVSDENEDWGSAWSRTGEGPLSVTG